MRFAITQSLSHSKRPLALLAATTLVALAAVVGTPAFAQPGPWGSGGADGMGPGMRHHMEPGTAGRWDGHRMLDLVGATPEQRIQIQQILKAAHADLQPLRASGRKLRQQAQALFTQPTIDASAAEALRQQELAVHDQVSKRMLRAMIDAANVLTPAQRQTLATKMAQRRALMEKQRAERAALDGGVK